MSVFTPEDIDPYVEAIADRLGVTADDPWVADAADAARAVAAAAAQEAMRVQGEADAAADAETCRMLASQDHALRVLEAQLAKAYQDVETLKMLLRTVLTVVDEATAAAEERVGVRAARPAGWSDLINQTQRV